MLYGDVILSKIERDFPVNDFYYYNFLPSNLDVTILDIGCRDGNFVHYKKKGILIQQALTYLRNK